MTIKEWEAKVQALADTYSIDRNRITYTSRNNKPWFVSLEGDRKPADFEFLSAAMALSIPRPEDANWADEAKKLVWGDREKDYGSPLRDYMRTAAVWSGLLIHKLKPGETITPVEAMLMMATMKICREFTNHKDDSMIDAHGYLFCAERAIKEQQHKE